MRPDCLFYCKRRQYLISPSVARSRQYAREVSRPASIRSRYRSPPSDVILTGKTGTPSFLRIVSPPIWAWKGEIARWRDDRLPCESARSSLAEARGITASAVHRRPGASLSEPRIEKRRQLLRRQDFAVKILPLPRAEIAQDESDARECGSTRRPRRSAPPLARRVDRSPRPGSASRAR